MRNGNKDQELKSIYETAVSNLEHSLSNAFNQIPDLLQDYKTSDSEFIKSKLRKIFKEHGNNVLGAISIFGDTGLSDKEIGFLTTLQDHDVDRLYQNILDAEIP